MPSQFHCTLSPTVLVTLRGEKKLSPTVTLAIEEPKAAVGWPTNHPTAKINQSWRCVIIKISFSAAAGRGFPHRDSLSCEYWHRLARIPDRPAPGCPASPNR